VLVDELLIDPALIGDVGEERVHEHQVGAGLHREMQHVVRSCLHLAGVDADGAARVDEDDSRGRVLLVGQFLILEPHRGAAQVRDPVVEEVVGLGLERVGADDEDGVGDLRVLVAVVELSDAHVAAGMDLRVVGRAVVDADVPHLHCLEVELAGAPGELVAAARPAVVGAGDDERVLVAVGDDPRRYACDEVERVVPTRRLHLAVAPDERIGQPLLLGLARG
jgi:hypothetical protein